MLCYQCEYWIENKDDIQIGECMKLPSDQMELKAKAGREGVYVEKVITGQTFFCAHFREAEDGPDAEDSNLNAAEIESLKKGTT